MAEIAYTNNPKLVSRQVLPVMRHLISSKPPGSADTRAAIAYLCETLYDLIGPSILNTSASLSPTSQKRLSKILKNKSF